MLKWTPLDWVGEGVREREIWEVSLYFPRCYFRLQADEERKASMEEEEAQLAAEAEKIQVAAEGEEEEGGCHGNYSYTIASFHKNHLTFQAIICLTNFHCLHIYLD